MPFRSEKQKRWMYANEPDMARRWSEKYGEQVSDERAKNLLGRKSVKMKPKYDEEMDKKVRGGVLDDIMGDMDSMMYEQKVRPILSITISEPVEDEEEEDDEEMDMTDEDDEEAGSA